jgi:poly(3-hydroxybutyrate) depolymerase
MLRTLARSFSVLVAAAAALRAQGTAVLDDSVPPGANFAIAQFRFWAPPGQSPLRAVAVLVPGSNGDGRSMAEDSTWQAFAVRNHVALIACRFTDAPHDQGFFEDYIRVAQGSGDALLGALGRFAQRSGHPEVATAPFLMWGMSAGGQFNYEFVAWKPERVLAFVVNKGGVYYSALLPKASRLVPGILFTGGKDLAFRTNTINGLFAVNRRGGALWALANEPNAAHVVGRSRDMAIPFYEDAMRLRLRDDGTLATVEEKTGFIGELGTGEFTALGDRKAPGYPTAWLPTERAARMWQALVTEKPFTP